MIFAIFFACAMAAIDSDMIEREKLAFIERNVVQILQSGEYPEIFGAENQRLFECGCSHGASGIVWGSGVGMMCKLNRQGYEDTCGARCSTPKGEDILLMCPEGWQAECGLGCIPPEFDSVTERAMFLEQNVDQIVKYGYDYIAIEDTYLDACACKDNRLSAIKYGTQIGFDCVVEGVAADDCAAYMGCDNPSGNRINIFCPAGHTPSCQGCEKTLTQESTLDERYDWSVSVLTGYIRESQMILDLTPGHNKVLHCGCTDPLQQVRYGSGIGYYCHIDNPEDVLPECGQNVICDNGESELVHFCPDGFVPTCDQGCGYWWKQDL